MLLSIGMIVKNEEKCLRDCLQALQPILRELSAELIIVDTGSEDHTVQIAKEYTDKVLFYDWTNDFAAARNVTLDKASGDWYMFVDADEIAEDLEDLIQFFKSGEHKKYNAATICLRNYLSAGRRTFSDFNATRLIRRSNKTRFVGTIHERFNSYQEPIKTLLATVGHEGYFYPTAEERTLKCERNRKLLLKEIEDNPDFALPYLQVMETYEAEGNFEEALRFYDRGVEVVQKSSKSYLILSFYVNGIFCYYYMDKPSEALSLIDTYFRETGKKLTMNLEIYGWKALAHLSAKDYMAAEEAFKIYDELYHEYYTNRFISDEMLYHSLRFVSPFEYFEMVLHAADACIKRDAYDAALIWLDKFPKDYPVAMGDYLSRLKIEFDVMKHKMDFSRSVKLYKETTEETAVWFQHGLLAFARGNKEHWKTVLYEFKQSDTEDDIFLEYLNILYDDLFNIEISEEKILSIGKKARIWDGSNNGLLYLMLKNKISLSQIVETIEAFELNSMVRNLCDQYSDFTRVTFDYLAYSDSENILELLWVGMISKEIIPFSAGLSKDERVNLLIICAECTFEYLKACFHEDILKIEKIKLVPKMFRFGYYVFLALESFEKQDMRICRDFLEEAQKVNLDATDIIRIMQNDVLEQEMELYKRKVKDSILNFILTEQFENAIQTIFEYEQIQSNDLEIEDMKQVLNIKKGSFL